MQSQCCYYVQSHHHQQYSFKSWHEPIVYTPSLSSVTIHSDQNEGNVLSHNHESSGHLNSRQHDHWKQGSKHTRFFHEIIQYFHHQRNVGEYQFAVLLLLDNTGTLTFQRSTGVVKYLNELVNRNYPTFPMCDELCNFVTARPDGSTHAETLLMECVPFMSKMPECQTILLYTWLFPCKYCTEVIIKTLRPYTWHHKIVLAFTTTLKDMDKVIMVSTLKSKLNQEGIDVRQEHYHYHLQRAE